MTAHACATIFAVAVRKYELKRRAERAAETRQRIVDAAIELHASLGPARTTLSDVARRAGVQRHTLYRYFPDERALGVACSGHYFNQNPMPDPGPWRAERDPRARLERGLHELYAYFERNETMIGSVLRDAEIDPLTRELARLRRAGPMDEIRSALAEGIRGRRRLAALDLALDFHAWRRLVRGSGLSRSEAVGLMAQTVFCRADRRR